MKRVLGVLGLFLMLAMFSLAICAQQTNPQMNFPATVEAANPSLWLNFNDLTTGFTDKVSGQSFGSTAAVSIGTLPTAPGGPSGPSQVAINNEPLPAGSLTSFSLKTYTAPTAGQTLTCGLFTSSGTTVTPVASTSFAVTLGATTATQTFTAPANFTAEPTVSGELFGCFAPSGGQAGYYGSGTGSIYYYNTSTYPTGAATYTAITNFGYDMQAGVTVSSGTVTPRQAGFDNTTPDNTSAAFPYNGFNVAPNNTLGAIDWNTPFSLLVHVDRLSWNRTGSLVLMSKGSVGSANVPGWELVLQMSGLASQLCFYEYGVVGGSTQGLCTAAGNDALPNGFNYDLVVTNSGTGSPGYNGIANATSLYINGLQVGSSNYPATNASAYGGGFGALSFSVSGGTGYAATTPVTITGGGPNCTLIDYEMLATNGVPTAIVGVNGTAGNFGCSSLPTSVSLTSPAGTGVTIRPSLPALTMNAAAPLMVPGYVSGGVYNGVGGTNTAAGTTYVDEAAIFPGVLNATQVGALFYQTKFYQGLLGPRPAVPPAVVFDEDGCGDLDNTWALEEAIALHKLGYINLKGTVQENNAAGEAGYFRQQLDQAGLANVPVGIPSDLPLSTSACNATALNTFNASTLTSVTYPAAAQVYRQVFAANAGAPVSVFVGAGLSGLANFMQSPADGISALTGAQLFARNAANGGVMYSQGGWCTASALPATTPCSGNPGAQLNSTATYADAAYVYANGRAMKMTAVGGTPAAAGPGPMATRTSKDPTYLQMLLLYGGDERTAWDSLPMSALVTPLFNGGVTVGYSGGTGYANTTLFTSTGGGPNCTVTGYLTASGGVPNGITTLWGQTAPMEDQTGIVAGLGYGCTSAPALTLVSPTGTGVTLTAYPTTVCGTASFPGYSTQTFASGTCSNQYVSSLSQWTLPSQNAPVYRWFLNSLVDRPTGGVPRLK